METKGCAVLRHASLSCAHHSTDATLPIPLGEGEKELDFSCSSSAHCRTTTTAVWRIVVKTPAEKLDRVAVAVRSREEGGGGGEEGGSVRK